jgi:hypothetical protein
MTAAFTCTSTITYIQLSGWFFAGLFAGGLLLWCATRYALSRYIINLQRMEARMLLTSQTVKWFGPSWKAPICDRDHHTARPKADDRCIRCIKGFDVESQGLRITAMGESEYPSSWHLDCLLQHIGGRR